MNQIDIQAICVHGWLPAPQQLQEWADTTLEGSVGNTEITVRIVDEAESAELNHAYRNKTGPTNILSFPFEPPEIAGFESDFLGDLVICAPVLEREAEEQHKPLPNHWAHILVHGILHLLGHDHTNETQATIMETKEVEILNKLNISNPYSQVTDDE